MTARESDLRVNECVICNRNIQSTVVGQRRGIIDPEGREK